MIINEQCRFKSFLLNNLAVDPVNITNAIHAWEYIFEHFHPVAPIAIVNKGISFEWMFNRVYLSIEFEDGKIYVYHPKQALCEGAREHFNSIGAMVSDPKCQKSFRFISMFKY